MIRTVRPLSGSRAGVVSAILLAIGVVAPPVPALAQAGRAHDGRWSLTRTGVGCTPAGLITVEVRNGRFVGSYMGGTGEHRLSGQVAADGRFSFTGRSPSDTVRFQGVIRGASGEGEWSVEGRACGGTLRMSRS
jgi:hypothetical protein